MARTELTVPSAYTPDGVKANYDSNIAASNDNFEELYGVETQTITTSPVGGAIITMPIVILDYATPGTDKVVMLPAVANTTLRRVNITKVCADTSTATITARTNEYLDGVQNGTLAMTALGLSVTFQVIDGKWVSDWVGKSAAAPDGQNLVFAPGGSTNNTVFYTNIADGTGCVKILDTGTHESDEIPSTGLWANQLQMGLGSSYVYAKMAGTSNGLFKIWSGSSGVAGFKGDADFDVTLETDATCFLKLRTGTYEADLSADSSGRLVSASGFSGDGSALTGIVDGALSSNVPLLNAANAYTNTNTVTVPTGTAVTGTGTISATLLGDLSANTGTSTAWADGDNTKLWWAQKFTAGATATATAVSLKLAKGSAVAPTLASSTITAYIHADSTGAVGSVLSGGTGTSIRFDSLTSTDQTEYYFGGMSAALTSGTAYWIVVKASAFETSAGSIVHDSKSATAGTYGTYNTGTSTWDYTAELAAWAKVHAAGGVGLSGVSTINNGVVGTSTVGYGGSFSSMRSAGVYGYSADNYGVLGVSSTSTGVRGVSTSGYGVQAASTSSPALIAVSTSGLAVQGQSSTARVIYGAQIGASTTNSVAEFRRTSTSNGTGPILLLNNAGSAASGNLITGQLAGVDKFTVGVEGNIITAGTIAATGAITSNSFPVSLWHGATGTAPSAGVGDGHLYFDTDDNTLYVYYSSAWHACFTAP